MTDIKKKINPLDIQKEEPKEKSSLDKMRERIAAQKKLEQDMMTQQSLRNQEKVSMRNKLSALTKSILPILFSPQKSLTFATLSLLRTKK